MGYLAMVFMTAATIACNRDDRTLADSSRDSAAVGTSGRADKVNQADQDFIRDAAIANMAEVELGKIAAERAANAEVKKFGRMMIDDHSKALDKLTTMAAQHSILVTKVLDNDHRELRDKLAKMNGADFDREYMDAMVDGHDKFVNKLESRVDKVNLAEWKERMANTLAKLKGEERAEPIVLIPEKSDNPITMSINQWAADTYPVAAGHLASAKTLDASVKKRTTN
jgi:putative membrane protein